MLCSSLIGFSSPGAGEFHPFQEDVLRMLNQTLSGMEADLNRKLKQTTASAAKSKEDLEQKEKKLEEAEAAMSASTERVQAAQTKLAEGTTAMKSCKIMLAKTNQEIATGDTAIGEKVMEIEQVLKILSCMGEDGSCDEDTQAMLRDLSITTENSEPLSSVLSVRVESLRKAVSQSGVARADHVAKVKATQAHINATNDAQQVAAEMLATSQKESSECEANVNDAARQSRQQKKLTNQAIKEMRASLKQLTEFKKGALDAFKGIVSAVEQKHGTRILEVCTDVKQEEVDDVVVPPEEMAEDAEMADEAEKETASPTHVGTPVIDRSQRQAFLRRRSAALPGSFFGRLSFMKRRSSILANKKTVDTEVAKKIEADDADTIGHDAEDAQSTKDDQADDGPTDTPAPSLDTTGHDVEDDKSAKDDEAVSGPVDIPTPSRNSLGAADPIPA
jgi:hypothetical protein